MVFLPKDLPAPLQKKLSVLSETEVVQRLKESNEDLELFLSAASVDKAWANDRKAFVLHKKLIQVIPFSNSRTALKILEICESSDFFFDRFKEIAGSSKELMKSCLKSALKNPKWLQEHAKIRNQLVEVCFNHQFNRGKISSALNKLVQSQDFFLEGSADKLIEEAIRNKDDNLAAFLIEKKAFVQPAVKEELFSLLIQSGKAELVESVKILLKLILLRSIEDRPRDIMKELLFHYDYLIRFDKKEIEKQKKSLLIVKLCAAAGFKQEESKPSQTTSFLRKDSLQIERERVLEPVKKKAEDLSIGYEAFHALPEEEVLKKISSSKELIKLVEWLKYTPLAKTWLEEHPRVLNIIKNELSNAKLIDQKKEFFSVLHTLKILENKDYQILLKEAIENNDESFAFYLISELDPFVLKGGFQGRSFIEIAVDHFGFYSIALKLIEKGVSILPLLNQQGILFQTLGNALGTLKKSEDAIKFLNELVKNKRVFQGLDSSDRLKIFNLLLSDESNLGEELAIKFVLVDKSFITLRDENGNTLLHKALMERNYKLAEVLLTLADEHLLKSPNKEGITPLYLALEKERTEFIYFLLDSGVSLSDPVDKDGNTALHLAYIRDEYFVIQSLLNYGAHPFIKNYKGERAIDLSKETDDRPPPLIDNEESLEDLTTTINLANLFADHFFQNMKDEEGRNLEGNVFFLSIRYFRTLLKTSLQDSENLTVKSYKNKLKELENRLKKLEAFAKTLADIPLIKTEYDKKRAFTLLEDRIRHQVKRLKEGEALLIPSGWVNHAMLLEVKKEKEGYALTIFNTGDGTPFHERFVTHSKTYINPVQIYEKVPLERIIETGFLKTLLEIKTETKEASYGASDLYMAAFKRFEPFKKEVPKSEKLFLTGQRAGSCTMRVQNAYVKNYFKNEPNGALILYEMKKNALKEVLKKIKASPEVPKNDSFVTIVKGALEDFSRTTLSHFLTGVGEEEDFFNHVYLSDFKDILRELNIDTKLKRFENLKNSELQLIEKRLFAHAKARKKGKRKIKDPLGNKTAIESLFLIHEIFDLMPALKDSSSHPDFSLPQGLLSNKTVLKESVSRLLSGLEKPGRISGEKEEPAAQISPYFEWGKESNLKDILKNLQNQTDFIDSYAKFETTRTKEKKVLDLSSKVLSEMSLPPIDRVALKDLSLIEVKNALENLDRLTKIIMENINHDPIAYPDRIIALYAAIAWIHALSEVYDHETTPDIFPLRDFAIDTTLLTDLEQNFHNVIYDPELKSRLNGLINYFNQVNSSKSTSMTLFAYPKWPGKEGSIQLPLPAFGEHQYLQEIVRDLEKKESGVLKLIDKRYEKLDYSIRKKITLSDFRIASLLVSKSQLPLTFSMAMTVFNMAYFLCHATSSDIEDKGSLPQGPILKITEKSSDLKGERDFVLDYNFAIRRTLRDNILRKHLSSNKIKGMGSYAKTHGPLAEHYSEGSLPTQTIDALSPVTSENQYTLQSPTTLRGILAVSLSHPLKFYHLIDWLKNSSKELFEKEKRVFLSLILFKGNDLANALKEDPSLGDKLLKALSVSLDEISFSLISLKESVNEKTKGELSSLSEAKLFLTHQKIRFLKFLQNEGILSQEEAQNLVTNERSQILDLLKFGESFKIEAIKNFSRDCFLASFLYFPPKEKSEYYLLLDQFLSQEEDQNTVLDPSIHHDAIKGFLRASDGLSLLFEEPENENGSFIRHFLKQKFDIIVSQGTKFLIRYPIVEFSAFNSEFKLDLMTGSLRQDGLLLQDLSDIESHSLYIELFKDEKLKPGKVIKGNDEILFEGWRGKNKIIFTLGQISKKKQRLKIEQEFEGELFKYIPNKKIPKFPDWFPLEKLPVTENYTFWASNTSERVLIVDKTTKEIKEVDSFGAIKIEGELYDWLEASKIPSAKSLFQLDDVPYVAVLKKEEGIHEFDLRIKYNRLIDEKGIKLEFRRNTHNQWVFLQDPNFHIAETQKIRGISPTFKNFLVLENDKKERKVLISLKTYKDRHETEQNTEGKSSFETALIDLTKEGKLNPKKTKDIVIAAYYYTLDGNLEAALRLLKGLRGHRRFSGEELKYLGWIIFSGLETGNMIPEAIALRNFTIWLVQENLFRHPKQEKIKVDAVSISDFYEAPELFEAFFENLIFWGEKDKFSALATTSYTDYLDIRKKVDNRFRLDSSRSENREALLKWHEESAFLSHLVSHPQIILRFNHIMSETKIYQRQKIAPKSIGREIKANIKAFGSTSSPFGKANLESTQKAIDCLRKISSRTRPQHELRDNFLNFLKVAEEGTAKEKQELLFFLQDGRFEPDAINKAIRVLLESVILKKENYKQMLQLVNRIASNREARESLERLNELLKEEEDLEIPDLPPLDSIKLKDLPEKPIQSPLSFELKEGSRDYFLKKASLGSQILISGNKKRTHKPFPEYKPKDSYSYERYQKLKRDYEEGCRLNDESLIYYLNEDQELGSLLKDLKEGHKEEEIKIGDLLLKACQLWLKTDYQEDFSRGVAFNLELLGRKKSPPTFQEMVSIFLQKNKQGYTRFNPNLTEEEVQTLHNLIGEIVVRSVDHSEIGKRIGHLKNLKKMKEKGDETFQFDTLQKLGSSYAENLSVDPSLDPELVVFEWAMNMRIRKDQVDAIKQFMDNSEGKPKNIFLQKIMGAGKTLVLGTLLALKKADGYHLSVLVPTSSLYDPSVDDMRIRSSKVSGQRTQSLSFRRGPEHFNKNFLIYFYNVLITAIVEQDSVILSPETLQSLENQYLDARESLSLLYRKLKRESSKGSISGEIQTLGEIETLEASAHILKKILNLFAERAIFTLDEPDQTLESKKELNFPLGDKVSLPKKGLYFVKELYLQAALDKEISELGLDLKANNQSEVQEPSLQQIVKIMTKKVLQRFALNEESAESLGLKPEIIRSIKELDLSDFPDSCLHSFKRSLSHNVLEGLEKAVVKLGKDASFESVRGFLNDKENKEVEEEDFYEKYLQYSELLELKRIYQYWSLEDKDSPEVKKANALFINELHQRNAEAAESVILVKQELQEWLKSSFEKSCDLHYGFSEADKTKRIAIPYSANNTPSENSEFADPWEMANRTLQLYIYKGLNFDETVSLVEKLKVKVKLERTESGGGDPDETPTAILFFKATGHRLLAVSKGDIELIEEIQKKLKMGNEQALDLMLSFVIENVIGKAHFYTEQINSNAQNLASIPFCIQGYTGTMENADTFPERVEPHFDFGTNGRILDVLLNRNNVVHTLKQASPLEHLKELLGYETLSSPKSLKVHALVDLGPIYKGVDSVSTAKEILRFFTHHPVMEMRKIKGVLTWDDKTKLLTFIKQGHEENPIVLPSSDSETIQAVTGLTKEEIFVFYPHHKLTGADVELPDDAVFLTTFSEKTPLRDFLQGNMRARKLFHNQKVEAIVLNTVADLILKTFEDEGQISLDHLVLFSEMNESERQSHDYLQSVLQKLNNEVRKYALVTLFKQKDSSQENEEYEKARALFIRASYFNLFETYAIPPENLPKADYINGVIDSYLRPYLGMTIEEALAKKGDEFHPRLQELIKNLSVIRDKALAKLPETIPGKANELSGKEIVAERLEEVESLKEQNLESQYQIELEGIEDASKKPKAAIEIPWKESAILAFEKHGLVPVAFQKQEKGQIPAIFRLSDVLRAKSPISQFSHCFSDNLLATQNFLSVIEGEINIFDSNQKKIYEVLVTKDKDEQWQVLLLSIAEAESFKKNLPDLNRPAWLLSAEGELIQASKNSPFDPDSEIQKLLVEVLFLKGSNKTLSQRNWRPYVASWLENEAKIKKFLYENVLLAESEEAESTYFGSFFNKMLVEASKKDREDLEVDFFSTLGVLAANNKTQKALILLRGLKSLTPLPIESFPILLSSLALILVNSEEIKFKKAARTYIFEVLSELLKRGEEEDLGWLPDALNSLNGVHDLEFSKKMVEVSEWLVKIGKIKEAESLILSRITNFKSILKGDLLREESFKEKILELRYLQLKMISLIENEENALLIKKTFMGSLHHLEESADLKGFFKELAQDKKLHPALDLIAMETFGKIENKISQAIDTSFGKMTWASKTLNEFEIIALLDETFFQYKESLPLHYALGLKLLEKVERFTQEYDYLRQPYISKKAIPIAETLVKSGQMEAVELGKKIARQFIANSPDFEKLNSESKITLDEILSLS
ncbi:ankyrin repeat domain-containing protein [Criblamydia sequanensis]|uniref:Uncharacterized protein n=1 Tax=Candidatus Criblamydia sequanensis CRIB-18 TaxID=1437425 RepID=A0A090E2V3_9BACT|nr:ankyrin repeat domain-containing protein [Criblamydia sequanensis]CDR34964.1 hypothetical protein CSEC_2158 [Criblamydia sequanensis CRIB-18]